MKNKKVCLLSPPSRSINHYRPPVALLYLAGYLEKNGVETDIVDITLGHQIRDQKFYQNIKRKLRQIERKIINQVKQSHPDIVGITCYTPEYWEVLSLAEKIKKFDRHIKIVAGGIHPTFYPQDFIYSKSPFDFAILGEGEMTLLELVKKIDQKNNWPKIKSIAFFDQKAKKMMLTPKRPLVQNLDEIAYPAYHKIDMEYYTTANPYAIRGVYTRSAYVLSSRGCPSACTFCVAKKIREFYGARGYVRLRSAEHLYQEIKMLKEKYQIDSFYFIDDLFTLDRKQVKEFCRLLKRSKLGLIWGCSSKVTTVDHPTLKAMRQAGCVQIDFGVERGSDEALQQIKKGITVKIIKKIFADCHHLGIRTFANMLVNLPGEKKEDLDDILKLLGEIKPTIVAINIFTPYPGTEIFEVHRTGITRNDYPNLMKPAVELIKKEPAKYRFAAHHVDISHWVIENTRKYNYLWPTVKFHLSSIYLKNLIKSKRKGNYLKAAGILVKELINQKF